MRVKFLMFISNISTAVCKLEEKSYRKQEANNNWEQQQGLCQEEEGT